MAALTVPGFIITTAPAGDGAVSVTAKMGPELVRFFAAAKEFGEASEALPAGVREMLGSFTLTFDPAASEEAG